MSLVKKGIRDRYIVIDQRRDLVTYLPCGVTRKLSNPEEKVQLDTFLRLIYLFDYPPEKLCVSDKIKIGSSTREADIVVYRDRERKDPLIIVECKKERVSDRVFEGAIDQGFSYAAVTRAEYVWAFSGDRSAAFTVDHGAIKERARNRLDRIPKHKEERKLGYDLRRRLRWLLRHPIFSDALLYGAVLLCTVIVLSKLAVTYHPQLYQATEWLWQKHGMDFNWVYNAVVGAAALFSLLFGMIFMRSHQFFEIRPKRRRLTYGFLALILFLPAWYIGESMHNPTWWTYANFQRLSSKDYPVVIYLWPYLKAFPLQVALIYALIWLISRGRR